MWLSRRLPFYSLLTPSDYHISTMQSLLANRKKLFGKHRKLYVNLQRRKHYLRYHTRSYFPVFKKQKGGITYVKKRAN